MIVSRLSILLIRTHSPPDSRRALCRKKIYMFIRQRQGLAMAMIESALIAFIRREMLTQRD